MEMPIMKIAITGGAGFIGSHLTKAYLDAGHDVFIIDNLLHGTHHILDERARFYQVDIRDNKVATILQKERPDVVSHHAVQRDDELVGGKTLADADVHVHGLLNVLDSCTNASVQKFIFASGSYSMYGHVNAARLPLHEDTPLCPLSAHDISKVAGEWYVRYHTRYYGLQHAILRYADTYGNAGDKRSHHPFNYFANMLLQQQRPIIRGTGNDMRDHIFVEDIIQANLLILKHGENCTLHISSGEGYTLNQLYHMTTVILDSKIKPLYIACSGPEIPAITFDNSQANRILGWSPQFTLPEGIRRATSRLREHRDQTVTHKEKSPPEMPLSYMSRLIHA
jgi:UDP-glucose 4-epimerase